MGVRMKGQFEQERAGALYRYLPQEAAARAKNEDFAKTAVCSANGEGADVEFPVGTNGYPFGMRPARGKRRKRRHLAPVPRCGIKGNTQQG